MPKIDGTGGHHHAAEVARDWDVHPAVAEIKRPPADVFCVADVHGDCTKLRRLLAAAGLARFDPPGNKVTWTGGRNTLVCTGDLIDKWGQSLATIRLFMQLQQQAAAAGGRVVVTMGNHEQRFLSDPKNAQHKTFVAELKAAGLRLKDVVRAEDSLGVGTWLRDLPVAAKVGDWFFVHAGNTHGRTIDEINADVARGVDRKGFGAKVLGGANSMLNARLGEENWWDKEGELGDRPGEVIDTIVKAVGARHLFEGHVSGAVDLPHGAVRKPGEPYRFFGKDGQKFFLGDAGLSRGVAGTGVMIHIRPRRGDQPERVTAIGQDGHSAEIDSFERTPGR